RWRLAIGVAAAACLSLVLLNVGRSWMSSPADTQPNTATVLPLHTAYYDDDDDVDERFEEFADYAMIDVDDIYAYVSEYQ
ncbi:MAG: hypothetical protein IJ605_01660, partial [Prevotella sp.]|nr:hypothetical protein [Prevotella sp.]